MFFYTEFKSVLRISFPGVMHDELQSVSLCALSEVIMIIANAIYMMVA